MSVAIDVLTIFAALLCVANCYIENDRSESLSNTLKSQNVKR